MDYVNAISHFYQNIQVVCFGDPNIYENLQRVPEGALPSKNELDANILQYLKQQHILELSEQCQVKIISGFTSNALGVTYLYDSEDVDQINLLGSLLTTAPTTEYPDGITTDYATRSVVMPLMGNAVNPKIYRPHTHFQLRRVAYDGAVFKLTWLKRFNEKRDYINSSCNTVEEVLAVTL